MYSGPRIADRDSILDSGTGVTERRARTQMGGTPFCLMIRFPRHVSFTTISTAVDKNNKKYSPRSPHDLMTGSAFPSTRPTSTSEF